MKSSNPIYRELADSEVRFMRLHPAGSDEPIECSTVYCSIQQAPEFIALSYVWGDPNDTKEIALDGQPFRVTQNLFDALEQLRQFVVDPTQAPDAFKSEYALFWIDAICINQSNLDEKSKQVPHIGAIYRSAGLVLAWLGPSKSLKDDCQWFFDLSNAVLLAALRQVDPKHPSSLEDSSYLERTRALLRPGLDLNEHIIMLLLAPISRSLQTNDDVILLKKVFSEVFRFSWFRRIWVIQEVVLATHRPIFMLGSRWCGLLGALMSCTALSLFRYDLGDLESLRLGSQLQVFKDLRDTINSQREKFLSTLGENQQYKRANDQGFTLEEGEHIPPDGINTVTESSTIYLADTLARVMASFDGTKQATKPHDYIYGFLPMIDPPEYPISLLPDYKAPYEDVFRNYATAILKYTGDLSIIPRDKNELVNMPSWVPDFRFPRCDCSLYPEMLPTCRDVRFESNDSICVAKGVRLGETASVYYYGLEDIYEAVRRFDSFLDTVSNIRNADKQVVRNDCINHWFRHRHHTEKEKAFEFYNNATTYGPLTDRLDNRQDVNVADYFESTIVDYSIFATSIGVIGRLDPIAAEVKKGDILAMMKGARFPFLLRPTCVGGHYTLVGSCSTFGTFKRPGYTAEYFEANEVEEFRIV